MQHLLLLQFRIRIFLCTHVYVFLIRLTINLFTLISVVRQGQLLLSRLDSWRKLGVGRRELKLGSVRMLYQRNPTICRFTTIFIFTVPTPLCGFCYFLYYEYECCCCEFLFISEDLSLRPILASLPSVLVLEILFRSNGRETSYEERCYGSHLGVGMHENVLFGIPTTQTQPRRREKKNPGSRNTASQENRS